MKDRNPANMPLRALKIIRKGYRNNRSNPLAREKLKLINQIIQEKERRFSVPKKVVLANPPTRRK